MEAASDSTSALDRVPGPAVIDRLLQLVWSLPGRGDDARAVLNGLFGDALADQGSSLATQMSLRTAAGVELPLSRDGLAAAFPAAGPRLCVLVHGLMSTESIWQFPERHDVTYGELLAEDRGVDPVYLRYNTGRHISSNGRELAALLQQLIRAWPVRVREIDLIGHSMGGLVIRSACHYGAGVATLRDRLRRRGPWPARVRRVVLLGVPNNGATLEVIANLTSRALWTVPNPVTRLVGAGLDRRSAGIKDLRWGAVLDEEWLERDPDATERSEPGRVGVPRHAEYLAVAGTLTDEERDNLNGGHHLVNRLLGDALVTPPSAHGRGSEPALLPNATVRLCPKIHHLALAHHANVYDEIASWWGTVG